MPVKLRNATLTSGDILTFGSGITLLVGPNNVGKSVFLQSVGAHLSYTPEHSSSPRYPRVPVVEAVEVELPPREEFEDSLLRFGFKYELEQSSPGTYYRRYIFPAGNIVSYGDAVDYLYSSGRQVTTLSHFHSVLGTTLTPESRLGLLQTVPTPNLYTDLPVQPLQILWQDRSLEERLKKFANRAFGIDLTVNRHGGSQIGLHVGKPATVEPAIGVPSEYLREVNELPHAVAQGHGVQAFLGMLLLIGTKKFDYVLIDEPEAFLHPPQARLLGEIFVELSLAGTQFVVATHSDDFLQGVLTKAGVAVEVTIARLTRPSAASNSIAQVPPIAVRNLYEDPLLRYSNVLDGIFYKGVVLCEAEADCKYYAAILDVMFETLDTAQPRPDLLFTQCGGKDRFNKALLALRATKVPVAVIADLDLLANEAKFKELFESCGGDWGTLVPYYNSVVAGVKPSAKKVARTYAKFEVERILSARADTYLSADESGAISDVVRSSSGWDLVKKNGRAALPKGQPVESFDKIWDEAAAVGLFILKVGELERFHPEIGGNKQSWLRRVFEARAYESSPEAATMLSAVTAYINHLQ